MDWTTPPEDQPIWSPAGQAPAGFGQLTPNRSQAEPAASRGVHPRIGGIRRTFATTFLAVGLLVVGGVAVVNAADPAASSAPSAATQPSAGNANGAAPGPGAPRQAPTGQAPTGQAPNGRAPAGAGHNCPNMAGSRSGSPASGGSTAPTAPTTPSTGAPSSSNL